jgi:hypothetical protein
MDRADDVIAAFGRHAQLARKIGALSNGDGEPRARYSGTLKLLCRAAFARLF